MSTRVTCPWCHEVNALAAEGPTSCVRCGHRVDRARLECDCATCLDCWRHWMSAPEEWRQLWDDCLAQQGVDVPPSPGGGGGKGVQA